MKVDGKSVAANKGETVLEAASRAGILIPTLCHQEGLPPSTSCFVCAVRVEGVKRLLPACSLPAEDGMIVTTHSEDVVHARRTALELLLSDHVGDCVAPCSLACPGGLDVPAFIGETRRNGALAAAGVIRSQLAFAGALGRICHRPCERVCRRQLVDLPVSICELHRYVTDRDLVSKEPFSPPLPPESGKRVAIVGAGPAGLACAYYLRMAGHACTLFEAREEPGGRYRHAIPGFRLPRDVVEAEIRAILDLNVELQTGMALGREVGLGELRSDFEAVFLAVGAHGSAKGSIEGEASATDALEFLEVRSREEKPPLGKTVVVFGEAHTALDAARTAARMGADVTLLVEHEEAGLNPPLLQWTRDALDEGVRIVWDGRVKRVNRDGDSRFSVVSECGGAEMILGCHSIVLARERCVDADFLRSLGLESTGRGVHVDHATMMTSQQGVFAGGELVRGAAPGVRAIGDGRSAAVVIDQFLRGEPILGRPSLLNVSLGHLAEEEIVTLGRNAFAASRATPSRMEHEKLGHAFEEVNRGLSDADVATEARRCLDCDCLKRDSCELRALGAEYGARVRRFRGERRRFEREETHPELVYESGKCIGCGACRAIADKAGERYGFAFIGRGFRMKTGVPFNKTVAEALKATARECAEACPTGALAIQRNPRRRLDDSGTESQEGDDGLGNAEG